MRANTLLNVSKSKHFVQSLVQKNHPFVEFCKLWQFIMQSFNVFCLNYLVQ